MSHGTPRFVTGHVPLVCHPLTPPGGVRAITASGRVTCEGVLAVSFRVDGGLQDLRIPALGTPRMGSFLWRHTCFEAFIAAENDPAYYEFNFAPSGEWAAYAFRGYRDGEPLIGQPLAPRIAVRGGDAWLQLDASVPIFRRLPSQGPLRLSLTAVIEAQDGALSYWALRHPPGAPDFHRRDGFALRIDSGGQGVGC